MKKLSLHFAFILTSLFIALPQLNAQDKEAIIETIDREVWKPFVKSWEALDTESFNALHADNVLRVSKWGVKSGSQYKEGIVTGFAMARERGDKRTIDFWFEERNVGEGVVYEVGYYKITVQKPGEDAKEYYARFHIVTKMIDGQWKIVQDWDSAELNGVKISKTDFEKGTPMAYRE
ncbi:nuclear transport factor 2 family protein [Fulvivirgaceae bacterium BMA12]|uniref:Nuclear transport factor 2 family protein n=1 Tax=Agaribacillus aureus TaxID=3051825 RepID=A0ABT8L7Q7_9BACT|nr:nuclear transport factor 2 family protein [Fulvivirgaceae bacterium BMA12]